MYFPSSNRLAAFPYVPEFLFSPHSEGKNKKKQQQQAPFFVLRDCRDSISKGFSALVFQMQFRKVDFLFE